MPSVVAEALAEPDVILTAVVLVIGSLGLAALCAPTLGRPRWLVALGFMSVAGIFAVTLVPHGGWGSLGTSDGASVGHCLGLEAWQTTLASPIQADTILNVLLYVPAGLLWTALTGRPTRVVLCLVVMCVLIESWQALTGTRACAANDVAANALGAIGGASIGAFANRLVPRDGSP